jgi:ABC-type glycerol-3-phosphate transport system substrate-binding protein
MAFGIESRLDLPDVVSLAVDVMQTSAGLPVPKSRRMDLKGKEVVIALPENAPDRRWDDALLANFERTTGARVKTIRPGNDTTAVLRRYQADLKSGVPEADVYTIDIVWPGILADFAEDLRPSFSNLDGLAPILVENDTVRGKLVALPYFAEVSVLYYRTDLIKKYRLGGPRAPGRRWNNRPGPYKRESELRAIRISGAISGRAMHRRH